MNKESLKVFLSCALGAGIGALMALDLTPAFWWCGLLVGGLTGYLSYEFKTVVLAVPKAYRVAIDWPRKVDLPSRYWERVKLIFIGWFWIGFWISSSLIFAVFSMAAKETEIALPPDYYFDSFLLGLIIFVLIVFFAVISVLQEADDKKIDPDEAVRTWRFFASVGSPHTIIFHYLPWTSKWLVRNTLRIIFALPCLTLAFARFCRRFTWQLFIRIHCERRLICGVDALFGAAIGYFTGSAIVGAVAGGLLGVINYEVVTKRWLAPRGYLAKT